MTDAGEHQVAGPDLRTRHGDSLVNLRIGGSRQRYTGLSVRPLGQTRAVESVGPGRTPHVGPAQPGQRGTDGAAGTGIGQPQSIRGESVRPSTAVTQPAQSGAMGSGTVAGADHMGMLCAKTSRPASHRLAVRQWCVRRRRGVGARCRHGCRRLPAGIGVVGDGRGQHRRGRAIGAGVRQQPIPLYQHRPAVPVMSRSRLDRGIAPQQIGVAIRTRRR